MKLKRRIINPKTKKQYRKIVKLLRRQVAFDLHYEVSQVGIDQICDHLIKRHRAGAYKASTWRLYRAAMHQVYGLGIGGADGLKGLDALTGGGRNQKTTQYGATRKMKSFPSHMFFAVMDRLYSGKKTRITPVLQVWMIIGLETGLRPHEWLHAEWAVLDGVEYLRVKNSKASDDRANGEYRHLDMSKVPDMTKRYVRGMLQTMAAIRAKAQKLTIEMKLNASESDELLESLYKNFYDSCRRKLRTILMDLYPGRRTYPSLYSLRHQFIANCKKDGMRREEIAALCGQASANTAQLHYGRKQVGEKGKVTVTPHPDEVKTVRISSKEFTPGKYKEVDLDKDNEDY